MKFKKLYTCLATTTLLTQLLSPLSSYATTRTDSSQKALAIVEHPEGGLLGYYFHDNQFNDLAYIQPYTSSEFYQPDHVEKIISSFNENKQKINSIRLMGYIKPSQTDEYQFSTSANTNVIVKLEGQTIINKSSMKQKIKLEKDKLYEITIEYRENVNLLLNLELFWSTPNLKKQKIPTKNLIAPNFSGKISTSSHNTSQDLIPNRNLFVEDKQNDPNYNQDVLHDTDKDGIPDEWEKNGYTIKNGVLTFWQDVYSEQGYKKYLSNPYQARTAYDPYTDFQKVIGYMPAATKSEARDPLVAAYPSVGVGMEKLLFSKNENVTEGTSNTKSTSTTKTNSNTNTVELGAKIGFTDKGVSFDFSPKYAHSWTSSTAVQDNSGDSWSKQVGINTDQAAFLNANVRYYNMGTAPIYEVRPTTNFILKNTNQSLATIKAGPNQIGNSLSPGDTYPKQGQAPISLDKANESGTTKISLTANQLDSIQSKSETINLETTQSSGQYGILDPVNGNLVTDSSKQWDYIRSNIDATSGSLILETGNETLERRVAARDVNNPEDKTPEITVQEAIKKAFGAIEKEGQLYYIEQKTGREIPIHENAINIVVDAKTQQEFNKQLQQFPNKSVYDLTFKRGMNITLHVPITYDSFELSNGWYYTYHVYGGHTGKRSGMVSPNITAYRQEPLTLEPYTNYTIKAWVKSDSISKHAISVHVDNQAGKGQGLNQELQLEGFDWKLLELTFNTGNHPEYFRDVAIGNKGNTNLYFDDIVITQWYPTEDWAKNHVISQWQSSKTGYIDGITFSKVPTTKVRYQLEIDGKLTDIKPASQVDSQGKRSINFKDFNNGNSIYAGSQISVYAVDERNDNLKVKVAEHQLREEDQIKYAHQLDFWIKGAGSYINGMYFKPIPAGMEYSIKQYKLQFNGQTVTKNRNNLEPNRSIGINFLDYNNGKGLPTGTKIDITAITTNGTNVFIGSYIAGN
ncbi:binary toxin-like calcium binding domain-containing protein [Bacillus thuringiensis]|uniref:binary toxin-like calcium binding domain-containing protein n=1 Tax=Bacillus thuringiensis TaxID=1428 RepID=UPI0029600146|nr:Iota toxin protein Ib [Bacillus cereus]